MTDKLPIISGDMVTVYKGIGQVDQNEGRGGTRIVGYYLTLDEVVKAVENEGVMGTPGRFTVETALRKEAADGEYCYFIISPITISNFDMEKVKREALNKLSDLEKKALGLK